MWFKETWRNKIAACRVVCGIAHDLLSVEEPDSLVVDGSGQERSPQEQKLLKQAWRELLDFLEEKSVY